ncbi:MAG: hypothetical protein AAF438_17090, partial [Pseudomonadota bacterium]
ESSDCHSPFSDFTIRLQSLWSHAGVIRGGIGFIIEKDHPAEGQIVVFSTRHDGRYDFSDNRGVYNISIGRGPVSTTDTGWPLLSEVTVVQGFGSISSN